MSASAKSLRKKKNPQRLAAALKANLKRRKQAEKPKS